MVAIGQKLFKSDGVKIVFTVIYMFVQHINRLTLMVREGGGGSGNTHAHTYF